MRGLNYFFFLFFAVSARAQDSTWETRYGPRIQDVEARVDSACSINRYSLSAADTVGKDALSQAEKLRGKLIQDFQQIQNPPKDLGLDTSLLTAASEKKAKLDAQVERLDRLRGRSPASDFEQQRMRVIRAKYEWDTAKNAISYAQYRARTQFQGGMTDPENFASYTRTLDQIDALYSKAMGCWSKQMGLACDADSLTLGNDGKCWFKADGGTEPATEPAAAPSVHDSGTTNSR